MTDRKPTNKEKRAQVAATSAELHRVTAGSTIRIAEPTKSKKRRASKPKVVALVGQTDDVLLEQASGFANFIREYAVVGLAVGFVVGQQANGLVKQIVSSFLEPLVKVWFGTGLNERYAIVHHHQTAIKVYWGPVVYLFIEFFFVLVSIYLLIKLFRLDKLRKVDEKK